jgi:integrase/recombinase XerD
MNEVAEALDDARIEPGLWEKERDDAVDLAREGIDVNLIQRQLGHADLGTTSTYLQGIDPAEIIEAVHSRRAPMIPATAGLRL